jgi:DNA-binding transcriptional ArsR family regulator
MFSMPGRAACVDVFQAVSDPTRRAILDLLRHRERTVTELAKPFAMSQPAVSQHLKVLRDARLVQQRRDGRKRIYTVDARPLRVVYDWIAHYERFWLDKLQVLDDYLEKKK